MYTKKNVRQKESSWRNVIIAVAEWKIAVSYMREHMHTKHMMRWHLAAYALSWGLSVEVQQPYVHSENDVILQLHQQKSKEIGVLQNKSRSSNLYTVEKNNFGRRGKVLNGKNGGRTNKKVTISSRPWLRPGPCLQWHLRLPLVHISPHFPAEGNRLFLFILLFLQTALAFLSCK